METNVNFTCRISSSLLERVRREAERNRRLVGAELMVLLEEGLARSQPTEEAAESVGR